MILIELGYEINQPDGVYDILSFDHVRKFQEDNLLYPYGVIDFATQDALYNALIKHIESNLEDIQLKAAIDALK